MSGELIFMQLREEQATLRDEQQKGDIKDKLKSSKQCPLKSARALCVAIGTLALVRLSACSAGQVSSARTLGARKSQVKDEFSANNRGHVAALLRADSLPDSWSLGQRRVDSGDDRASVQFSWSQPDPRKRFSPLLGPIVDSSRAKSAAKYQARVDSSRNTGRFQWRNPSDSHIKRLELDESQDSSSGAAAAAAAELGASHINQRQQPTLRRPTNNILTLIRYVPMPVLVSLPQEQLISLSSVLKPGQVPIASPNRLVLAKQLEEQKVDSEGQLGQASPNSMSLAELASDGAELGAPSQPTGAYIIQPNLVNLPLNSAKLTYLAAPVQAMSHVSAQAGSLGANNAGAASKALTAYASKLMSMLKPSALLSSMGAGSLVPQAVQAGYYPPAPIYLVAPASSDLVPRAQRQHRVQQLAVGSDVLLDQASRMHTQSTGKNSIRSNWQAPTQASASQSAMICLHGLARTTQAPLDQYLATPSSGSTSGATTEPSGDLSSFDYVANSLDSKKVSSSLPARGSGRESPGKLAHKLAKINKDSSSPRQQLIEPQRALAGDQTWHSDDEQSIEQQQQQSSPSDLSTRRAAQPRHEPTNSTTSNRRLAKTNSSESNEAHSSIIPFTIRDKIDLQKSVASSPVQYDEPAEESHADISTRAALNGAQWAGERESARTSPQSNRKLKLQPEHEAINYRKVVTQGPDYSVPLLMASSSSSSHRQALNKLPDAGELAGAAASSAVVVTTSSTLDGQPVTLASGKLSAKAAADGRMILVSSSASAAESKQTSKPSEILVDSTPAQADADHAASRPSSSHSALGNHLTETPSTGPFSHDKLLTMDNSMDEFARISAALQTNPLDLIDLQNSRSSFELPSQLESLSMFQHYTPTLAARRFLEVDGVASTKLGQVRSATKASHRD